MEEHTENNYELVENYTYNNVGNRNPNATTNLPAKMQEFPSPAKSSVSKQIASKYGILAAVVIGFNTLLAFVGVAIGIFAYIQVYKLNGQTSASVTEQSSTDVLQLQNSVAALQSQLNSLSEDILGIQFTANNTILEIRSGIKNLTGPPGMLSQCSAICKYNIASEYHITLKDS